MMVRIPGFQCLRVIIASRPFSPSDFTDKADPLARTMTTAQRKNAMRSLAAHWRMLDFDKWEGIGPGDDKAKGEDVEYWVRHVGEYELPRIWNLLPHLHRSRY